MESNFVTCSKCFKIFQEQKYLDKHFALKHQDESMEEKDLLHQSLFTKEFPNNPDVTNQHETQMETKAELDGNGLMLNQGDKKYTVMACSCAAEGETKDNMCINNTFCMPLDKKIKRIASDHCYNTEITYDKIECSICAEKYENITDYTHHLKVHLQTPNESQETIACKLKDCNFKYKDKDSLLKFIKSYGHGQLTGPHLVAEKQAKTPLKCKECDEHFDSVHRLAAHSRIHKVRYPCHNCGILILDKDIFDRHKEKCLPIPGQTKQRAISSKQTWIRAPKQTRIRAPHDKPFQCQQCDKNCSSYFQLMMHMRSHTRGSLYTCHLCPRTFHQLNTLEKHQSIEHGNIHKCTDCSQICGTQNLLSIHRKYCRKSNLLKHLFQHSNFKCPQCSFKCTSGSGLASHLKMHSNNSTQRQALHGQGT